MAINFTKNVEQYTTAQKGNSRVKRFTEFTSKKQLQQNSSLTNDELDFVLSIKGTFSFALHEDGRYMAITLYRAHTENKYSFLVVDLQEEAIAEVESIKVAKIEIINLVTQNKLNSIIEDALALQADDEDDENSIQFMDSEGEEDDTQASEADEDEGSENKSKSRRSKKAQEA